MTQQQRDPADVLFICSLEDLNCLHDYIMAAMAGEDLSELPRLWNQQIGVIRSRPYTPAPTLYKTQTDDDGAIGKVAICLCGQCKVNGFLCQKSPRAIGHAPTPIVTRNFDDEHTAPASAAEHMLSAYAHGKADGAKAERERVLGEMFPKATGDNLKSGWIHSCDHLEKLKKIIDRRDEWSLDWEDIQEVLIAIEESLRSQPDGQGGAVRE